MLSKIVANNVMVYLFMLFDQFFLPNAEDQPDHGIKFLRAGVVAINFMSWSRMHPIVGQNLIWNY